MEENREKSIVNKVVVVTGGSRGIGAQIVKTLANENYKVILNYNNSKEQAEKIQQELLEQGKEIEIIKADVSKREETEKLIQFAINKFNKIDVLINNAGISQEGLFTDVTEEEWQKIINTNLNSVFYCNQQALKYMIQEQQGCIINISSIWGETGASCEVAYSTTKAAIIIAVTFISLFLQSYTETIPENPIKAIAIRHAVRSTMAVPWKGFGISLYSIFSRTPAISTMAIKKPKAVAKP